MTQIELPKNIFKRALKEKTRQIGIWCTLPDNSVVEILAGCGYDWILIDTEHAPTTTVDTMALMQAASAYPVTTIVRPSWNNAAEIKKLLDCGAQTLLIPYVQNAQEAKDAVAAVTYPPKGIRGVSGLTRASRYGGIVDYAKHAHEEICLLVQAESAEALEQIESIAAVEGVDGIFIGPADLAASMGYTGEPSHPKVKAAILDGIKRINAAGKASGVLSSDQDFLKEADEANVTFMAIDIDVRVLRHNALSRLAQWKN
ncbi:MAG: 4-hydroxy-2-oxo-heptane-1,7-dioate aldolase [Rhizobiales bacterium]|nr:4-hydroxy-2-oxo-heptane-1,7-dioate aldolase [Hyphomicrobiales bacterium]